MMADPCKYEREIGEVVTNIKWIRKSMEDRNGILEDHIKESDKYRKSIDRNTTWRHAFKYVIGIIFLLLGRILWTHLRG